MSFCTRAEARKGSSTGEQGETEGVLRHLMERGDCRVVYFGAARGDMSELCHRYVPSAFYAKDETDQAGATQGWKEDADNLKDEEIVALINVTGPPATFSYPGNPKGSTVQMQGMKYTAPILALCETFQIPRCLINNDPRTYPRDQEMSFGWKWVRPRALLDQCSKSVEMTVGGVSYNRVSVYAGAESWAWLPPPSVLNAVCQRVRCMVIAHAHIGDNCKQRKRNQAWTNVLLPKDEWFNDFAIYGAGWEHWSEYDVSDAHFGGVVKPDEALRLFNEIKFTPCVSAAPGFYTGKPYVAYSQGCVPLFYGDGTDPYTWDPKGALVPLDDPRRIVKPGDLWRILGELDYETELSYWAERLKPRWQMLDQLVDYLLAGRELGETFGGYFRC